MTLQGISAYGPDGRALVPPTELTVQPGERVRIIMEPTRFEALARIVGGLTEPDNGEVILNGTVGYMSPDAGFWEDMTVLDNTALPLTSAGVSRYERRDAAFDVLDSLGIGYAAHIYPQSLGLCERRLAALARALVKAPTILLLADPASMLDERETGRLVSAVMARWEADKFAVLYCGSEIIPADQTIVL